VKKDYFKVEEGVKIEEEGVNNRFGPGGARL
jgi:hypothetical protein